LGSDLAVAGPILEIGQNVLKSSFKTGSSDNPSYFQSFFLLVFVEEAFVGSATIIYALYYYYYYCYYYY
jgi:hypothetical protein